MGGGGRGAVRERMFSVAGWRGGGGTVRERMFSVAEGGGGEAGEGVE